MFDTRELGRKPGSMMKLSRSVPAPERLSVDMIGVPAEDPIQLDLRLEGVVEGVLVTGEAHARIVGECVRCLDSITRELDVDFQEMFAYPEADTATQAEEAEGGDDVLLVEDDHVDLTPVVRDAVVLALPLQPVCREDCPGLCAICGARLADAPEHRHEEEIDPRWAALRGWASTEDDQASGADGADENQEK